MRPIPDALHGRPFTRSEAHALDVSDTALRGRRFVRLFTGIYRTAETEPTLDLLLRTAQLVLPCGVAVSHVTNLRLRGLHVGSATPLHFATNRSVRRVEPGLVLHRYRRELELEAKHGFVLLPPARTMAAPGFQPRSAIHSGAS